jgi:hypothetical protein
MATATRSLRTKLWRLEALAEARRVAPVLEALRADPLAVMTRAGLTPDDWQRQVLEADAERMLLLCGRQCGKSFVSAALALRTALLRPRSPVLLLSPSLRQSGELFRKILNLFNALDRPVAVRAESALRVEFANGSRILLLPGKENTIRGFSDVALLVIDEAARVPDALYYSVRPMLAVSQGRLVALSTPFGKRGFFYEEWHGGGDWRRVRINADQCPRIPREFLAEERRALGERYYRQEYQTSFEDTIDAVFADEDIQAALCDDVQPLFGE